MKRIGVIITAVLLSILAINGLSLASDAPSNKGEPGKAAHEATGILTINGKIVDAHGNPVAMATVDPFMNGKPFHVEAKKTAGAHGGGGHANMSGENGLFSLEVHAAPEQIKSGQWSIKVTKPSFKDSKLIPVGKLLDAGEDDKGISRFSGHVELLLDRLIGPAFWVALVVLIGIYVLIAFELVHRTLAALLGAAAVLAITHTIGHFDPAYQVLTFEQSLGAVDWNVIFLLMGMMIIVGVLKESGVFQWMAYKSFELSGGRVFLLTAVLCIVTAVLSAFLDNVTTMLLLTPVTIELALILGISPFALLMPEIMASNFGGTATLIGDPPNIMIGSFAGLTFNDFVMTLTPVVAITMVAQILYTKWYYGKTYKGAKVEDVPKMIGFLKEKYQITDLRILYVGGTVLLGVVTLFIMHGYFHMEVSVAALLGAALVLFLNKVSVLEVVEKDIEWPSLIFFIMLFIIVGAAEETGILQFIATWIMKVCQGDLTIAILLIMWSAAILSAIVDNIPFTATMLPVVAVLSKTIPGAESMVLWWALAVGACFGGNATIIGASANVITTGIAEKAGHKISFIDFIKHGTPITIVSLIIASIYFIIVWR
jgi:Na+/H+ antiporter NhaD/arsenite permease-like protein